tara:strand:+ start:627 stop:881 length:255 start_codon:yes stop_codon:yes gene_type:complete
MIFKYYFIDTRRRERYSFVNNNIFDDMLYIGDDIFNADNTNIENINEFQNSENKNTIISEFFLFIFLISIPICVPLLIYYFKYQ